MNIDFTNEPLFSWYVILLMVSGVLMLPLAAIGGGMKRSERLFGTIAGVGFFGYGFYLAFLSKPGSYTIFFYVFVVPVLLIVKFVQAILAKGKAAPAPAAVQPYGPIPGQGGETAVPPQNPADPQNAPGTAG